MMMQTGAAIIIGGLSGSSGKTVVSGGLAAAWRGSKSSPSGQGYRVIPFKKGPDYVDAAWLARSAGSPCYSLDTYLLGPEATRQSFFQRSRAAGPEAISLIEGNRGLFDGMDEKGSHSTAELAKLLGVPVVVVADCTKTTRTMAAMLLGCKLFDQNISIAGVILNKVGSTRHEGILKRCIESECGIPVFGCIPRQDSFAFPERHLGLVPPDEHPSADPIIERTARLISDCVDTEGLLALMKSKASRIGGEELPFTIHPAYRGASSSPFTNNALHSSAFTTRIGVFRDSAFQFYYPENLEALTELGAQLVYISPIEDAELPQVDALYIGGGFPETHGPALAANSSFKESLHEAVEAGLPVYAECGGLMYLGRSLSYLGRRYPMAGILPVEFGFGKKPKWHGYSEVSVLAANPFLKAGQTLRGHEFHYSFVREMDEGRVSFGFAVKRGHGLDGRRDGMVYKGVMASYTHIHALGAPSWAEGMIRAGLEFSGSGEITARGEIIRGYLDLDAVSSKLFSEKKI